MGPTACSRFSDEETTMKIEDIIGQLDAAKAAYLETKREASTIEEKVASAHAAVKKLQAELSAAITEGAQPCPDCGAAPHGMIQPRGIDGIEFEVGCTNCRWFLHT